MQREIKFRAWDKTKRQWIYPLNFASRTNGTVSLEDTDQSNYDLSQFTGLNDKNGKEIYEGDIIEGYRTKIIVKYGIQHVDAFEGVGFNLWAFYGKGEDIGKALRLQSEVEVIGNVWENPELIPQSNH